MNTLPPKHNPFTWVDGEWPEDLRRRQSLLQACCYNEQSAWLEESLLIPVMKPIGSRDSTHREALKQFVAEEEAHIAMFRANNRELEPELYRDRHQVFFQFPLWSRPLLSWLSTRHALAPALLLIITFAEERSIAFSKACLAEKDSLDPRFVECHRRHLLDEARHVPLDLELFEQHWHTSDTVRQANARLLRWGLKEFFLTPKRSSRAVLNQLAQEFPAHKKALTQVGKSYATLGDNPAFRRLQYGPESCPRCHRLMQVDPVLAPMATWLAGE
jgi:P-aminobenzoate N-oxygenase AurF